MIKNTQYDETRHNDLVAERDSLESKRKDEAKRIHDMMESDKGGWDQAEHLKFREYNAKHDWYKGEIAEMDAEIKALETIRPQDSKTQKRKFEGDPLVRWIRNGRDGLEAHEVKEQQDFNAEGSFGGGGTRRFIDPIFRAVVSPGGNPNVLDETVVQSVIDGLADFGGMVDCMTVAMTADGNTIKYPVYDDGTTRAQVPAGTKAQQQVAAQTENPLSAFTQRHLEAFVRNTGFIDISRYLEEDVKWDVGAFVRRTLMRRMGRLIEHEVTFGSHDKKTGDTGAAATNRYDVAAITAPFSGSKSLPVGMIERATDFETATNATAFDWTDFNRMVHSIDRAWLRGEQGLYGYPHMPGKTGFMCNWTMIGTLKNLKDDENRPLLIPSINDGMFSTLVGYPVFVNQELPEDDLSAANKRPIYFGNWSYFVLRFAGAGLAIEQHYDSATAVDNTYQYMGRLRYDSEFISTLSGEKTPVVKALKRKT